MVQGCTVYEGKWRLSESVATVAVTDSIDETLNLDIGEDFLWVVPEVFDIFGWLQSLGRSNQSTFFRFDIVSFLHERAHERAYGFGVAPLEGGVVAASPIINTVHVVPINEFRPEC